MVLLNTAVHAQSNANANVSESTVETVNDNYKNSFAKREKKKKINIKESKTEVSDPNYKHQAGKKEKTSNNSNNINYTTGPGVDGNYKHQVPLKRKNK